VLRRQVNGGVNQQENGYRSLGLDVLFHGSWFSISGGR